MTTQAVEKKKTEAMEKTKTDYPTYRPNVDVIETDNMFLLTAEMPGVDEKGVTIEVEGHDLLIQGETSYTAPDNMTVMREEYRKCNYERSFTLGDAVDRDSIKARIRDGILQLELPKQKEAQARKITVTTG